MRMKEHFRLLQQAIRNRHPMELSGQISFDRLHLLRAAFKQDPVFRDKEKLKHFARIPRQSVYLLVK